MADIQALRQLYEARKLGEAWAEYGRLLRTGPVAAEGHLLGALAARFGPQPNLIEARRALERIDETQVAGTLLGRIRLAAATVLREIGEVNGAIQGFETYIAELDRYPELRPVTLGIARYNLGLALRCARRLADATREYLAACAEFRAHDFPDYLRQALQNLAWVSCLQGDAGRAVAALDEAEPLCRSDEARWQQRLGRAHLDLIVGDYTAALLHCEEIIAAAGSAPPGVVSQAHWVAGRVALRTDRLDLAQIMQQGAVQWSLKVPDDLRPMQDANSLRQDIHAARVHKTQERA